MAIWNTEFYKDFPFETDISLTTPEQVKTAITDLETSIEIGEMKAGDILDVEYVRGCGYYFIYENAAGGT